MITKKFGGCLGGNVFFTIRYFLKSMILDKVQVSIIK